MNATKSAKFKSLSEIERAVVETMRMRLTERQALIYLNSETINCPMSRETWYRYKRKINKLKLKRLYHIAEIGFEDQHLERIDQIELIQKLMWTEYHKCKSPYQRAVILEKILNVQPYLSSYYDATKVVMSNRANDRQTGDRLSVLPEGKPEQPEGQDTPWI